MVNFNVSKEDAVLIGKVAERAKVWFGGRAKLEMDITACHANGCPLDLELLLEFDNFSFLHDVCGIQENLDRSTGRLTNFFSPRSEK